MSKRILSILMIIAVIFSTLPAFEAVASSDVVDLIHNSDGTVRTGVVPSYYGIRNGNTEALGGGAIDKIIDGNAQSIYGSQTTHHMGSTGSYYQIDLGEIKTITYIKYSMMHSGFSDNLWRHRNYRVLLSNDSEFEEYEVVATVGNITESAATMPRHCVIDLSGAGNGFSYNTVVTADNLSTSGSGYEKEVKFAGATKRYRYVRVEKIEPQGMSCDEIVVMGIEGSRSSFGAWTVSDNQDGTQRNFSIPVMYENSLDAHEFDLMSANYDEDGKMTKLIPSSDGGDELTATIPITSADVRSITAVLPKDNNYLFIPKVATYGFDGFNSNIGTAAKFTDAHTVYTGDNYFKVDGKAVSKYDLIVAKAVKSDADKGEDAFSGAGTTLSWYGATISNNGYSFKMPFDEYGKYHICISRYPINGVAEHQYYTFSMVNALLQTQAIEAIISADTDIEIKAAVDNAVDTAEILSEGVLLDRTVFNEPGIGTVFSEICQLLADDDVSVSEVAEILNTAAVVYRLKMEDITLYNENSELVDGNADVKDYVQTELRYSYTADVTSSIANGASGVTNIDSEGIITYTFTEEMNPSSLTSNVIIKKNGTPISYSAYKRDKNCIVIDKSILESNSNYEVSFGPGCKTHEGYRMIKNPKFTFSTGEIIDAPYKEGYIIKNVSKGKDVSEVATQFKPASAVVDGDLSSFVLLEEDPVIDLGDYYDVFRITLFGADSERSYHLREASILANQSDANFEEDNITLFTYPFPESELQKLTDLTLDVDEGKIRYFKLKQGISTLLMREFIAYAYVKNEFGEWVAPTFSEAGTYTFLKPITEHCGAENYHMIINAYDSNGYTVAAEVMQVTAQDGNLSGSITVPAETVGISASIVSDITSMEQLTDSVTIGNSINTSGTAAGGISISGSDTGVKVQVGKSDAIKKTSRVIVALVSTTDTGITAQQAFNSMTAEHMENNLVFMSSVKCGDGIYYNIDNVSAGKYYIRVTVSDIDGVTNSEYYKFTIIDSTEKGTLIADFMGANTDAIKLWTTTALDTTEIISYDDLNDKDALTDDDYFTTVQLTRDMLYKEATEVTEIGQVMNILNAAAVVHSCLDGDTTKSMQLISQAGALLGDNFDVNVNVEKFLEVLSKVKTQITDGNSLGDVLRRCGMLSYMQKGTNADKISVLNNYSSEFGVDLSYPATKGVTMERAAEYLDCSDVSIYYNTDMLKNAFITAVDSAANEQPTSSKPIVNDSAPTVSGPSFSGGGGSSFVTPTPSEATQPGGRKELFSDIETYGWAIDSIEKLCEQNVLSGYEDGTFRPENFVTRAEFITMLAIATKVQVIEDIPMNFIDVPDDSWYFPYIRIAYTNSLCNGASEYYFNPGDYVTRQDMAVLIYNYMKYMGMLPEGEGKVFTDSANISDYATEAVKNASAAGIINGFDDGSFRPKDNARRVDAAVLISKIIE